MHKIMIIPNNKEMLNIDADAFLLGIKNHSVNMPFYIELDELDNIMKNTNKEIFISLNRNIHNNSLEELKRVLLELNKYDIKSV